MKISGEINKNVEKNWKVGVGGIDFV